ncbi:MAG: hypothetical protein RBR35_11520 [Salinivirgaceae bacterium]|nr:hypothetical protein [Salinivirgaceae bacterium]
MAIRVVFLIIVLLHGFIHLLGFVKAFDLQKVKALSIPVSKPMGVAWFMVTVLFLLYGTLYYLNIKYAWLFGIFAMIASQILIIYFWNDAKFGTIPNLFILTVVLISFGSHLLLNEFTSYVEKDFSKNNTLSTDILTEHETAHLPPIVQTYLVVTKSVGQPKIKNFKAEFVGRMRSNPTDKHMNFKSVQYNFFQQPSRYFYMTASKMGLPATGQHMYQNEKATFEVRLLNWFKVVDAKGDKLDQAETVTLFSEMCFMAPATLIDNRITWETVNDTTVNAIFKNGGISIRATLYFNARGELVNSISNDRYDTDGEKYTSYPWATPVGNYRTIKGYWLPSTIKLIYQKPEGNFIYDELEFNDVRYNLINMEE